MPLTSQTKIALLLGAALLMARPAIAASPTKGECIDASETGQDLQRTGRLLEAHKKLALCVAGSCPGPVREDCAARLKDIAAAMPSILFEARDAEGTKLADVRVMVDGTAVADKLDGTPIEVDPGEHQFAFEDPTTGVRTERAIVVREAEKRRHVSIVLGPAPEPEATPSPGNVREREAMPSLSTVSSPTATPSNDPGSTQRTWGLTLGGVGLGGIVLGGIVGLVASGTYNSIPQACRNGSGPCSASNASTSGTAHSEATVSTIGLVAGAAFAAGGAVLYFTAPKATVSVAPSVGMSGVGARVAVAW